MWACLQDQETPGHWKHVAGWRKVCELAQNHLRQLRQYRAGLAEAWPPATNAAARTYLGELDELISKVQRTHDTAAANHDALAAVARAIDSTRPELKRIRDDYAEKLARKRGYEATLADPKAAAGSRVVDPPVTDADLERLNVQARGLMFGLSGELQQAQAMLQKPPVARPGPRIEQTGSDPYGSQAPTLPPIMPFPIATSPNSSQQPKELRSPQTTKPATVGPINGDGPILGGTGSSSPPSTITPAPNTPPTSNAGMRIPPIPPPTSITRALNRSNRTSFWNSSGLDTPPKGRSINPAPSGSIGRAPGPGVGQPGETPTRRVNPIGGVIGGGAAGTAPSGAAGSRPGTGRTSQPPMINGLSPIGGAPGAGSASGLGGGIRNPHNTEKRQWDPDHPWDMDRGVTPIMLPPEDDGPIDPGPAIGLPR